MLDLMFAAALSGMRAGASSDAMAPEAIEFDLPRKDATAGDALRRDWRERVRPDFSFQEEGDCPIFFQQELRGFGSVRIGSLCPSHVQE
jgi:hypothetical protein